VQSAQGCYWHVPEQAELLPCQQGRWQLVVGSSNALLTTLTLINLIQPGALDLIDDALLVEHFDLLDIVRGTLPLPVTPTHH